MEGEPARAELAKDYPEWHIFRRGAFVCAWLPAASGIVVEFRDATAAGLRDRLAEYDRVWAETSGQPPGERAAAALAAARDLKTEET